MLVPSETGNASALGPGIGSAICVCINNSNNIEHKSNNVDNNEDGAGKASVKVPREEIK